jgi:hypothetical protein
MIESGFQHGKDAESVGSSGDQTGFVVQALDDDRREGFLPGEPVQDQRLMIPQRLCDLPQRRQSAAQGAGNPSIEERLSPAGWHVQK